MSKSARIQRDIDRFLDGFLSSDRNTETVHTASRRDEFSRQWKEYEEENLSNFF